MNATSGATMHPMAAYSAKLRAETQRSGAAMLQHGLEANPNLASNPWIKQALGQAGQPVPATPGVAVPKPVAPPSGAPGPIPGGIPKPIVTVPPSGDVQLPYFPDNGEVRVMPAPGRPNMPPAVPNDQGQTPSDVRIRRASRIR
jgi:hypothetical protein